MTSVYIANEQTHHSIRDHLKKRGAYNDKLRVALVELLRMIMGCTWSHFAQQAERERQQLKNAKPVAVKKGGVKRAPPPSKLPQPKPLNPQLATPQVANAARADDDSDMQPIAPLAH